MVTYITLYIKRIILMYKKEPEVTMASLNETNAYDLVNYDSFPYSNTDPEHLYTIARLFCADAVDPREARILELGCAAGGNIIPMAAKYPKSELLGIDLSSIQIAEGKKQIEALKLNNINLKEMSITEIDSTFGKFDYIIVHGILSWVPQDVRDKIFEICGNNLTKKGLAYISYNTLPGWSVIRGIREMMLYHTDNFSNPSDKSREARMLLKFIKDGNKSNEDSPYTKFISNEIDILSKCKDSYLLHDHLEANNHPYYFHEFIKKSVANGLQYLGDTSLSTMFSGNMPKETFNVLKQVSNDIVRSEQYMDFIRNRRFRSSILCHKDAVLNRNILPERMKDFYIESKFKAQKDTEVNAVSSDSVVYKSLDGSNLNTTNKYLIVALDYLAECFAPIHVKDLIQAVKNRIGKSTGVAQDEKKFENILLTSLLRVMLINSSSLKISSFPANYEIKVNDKPKISKLVRYQSAIGDWVTNQRHEKITVDSFSRVLLQHLDGENDIRTLVEKMLSHIANGDLKIKTSGDRIADGDTIKQITEEYTKTSLEKLKSCAILVA